MNIPQSIPNKTNCFWKNALGSGLYPQVVVIHHQTAEEKDKERSSDTKINYLLQGNYTRSPHWFKLDPDWIDEIFLTRDPDLFKRIHQKNIPGQANKDQIKNSVPILREK